MESSERDTQKHNQQVHTQSLAMTRCGDGLVDPKLVLSWLLTSVGAGPVWVVLLATGLLGVLAEVCDVQTVVWVLTGMSLLGGLLAFGLRNP